MLDATHLTGQHLIAGTWVTSENFFESDPVTGEAGAFYAGGADEINEAVTAAVAAFAEYGWTTREARAAFLEKIAGEIEARGPALTEVAMAETGLPAARLEGERGRTCGQLRLFAAHIRDGGYLDIRHDKALPDRAPLPRPDLRLMPGGCSWKSVPPRDPMSRRCAVPADSPTRACCRISTGATASWQPARAETALQPLIICNFPKICAIHRVFELVSPAGPCLERSAE